jgi:integrase
LGAADTPENRAKALDLMPEIVADLFNGNTAHNKRNVEHYTRVFLKMREREGIKLPTLQKYNAIATKIVSKFGRVPIADLKSSEVRDYFSNLLDRRCAKTVADYLTVLRGIFQEAIYDEAVTFNLANVVRLPKEKKVEPEPFSANETAMLLEHSEGWLKSLIALLAYTGIRTGEAIALKWADVNLDTKEIRVRETRSRGEDGDTKTESSDRTIPIFSPLEPYLRDQFMRTGLKGRYVFLSNAGEAWYNTGEINQKYWRPLLKRLGLKERRLYELRHTYATNMLDSGKYPVGLISGWLGHNDYSMIFKRYAKRIKGEQKQFDRTFDFTMGSAEKVGNSQKMDRKNKTALQS